MTATPQLQATNRFLSLSRDLIGTATFDGHISQLSPAWSRLLGYPNEELINQSVVQFVHADDRAATLAAISNLNHGEKTVSLDNRFRCSDGTYRWITWNATADPEVGLIYFVGHDVTAAKENEAQLRTRAAELETVAKVSAAAARILNMEELLQNVADLTKQNFDLYHAHVYLLDETGQNLILAAGAGEIGKIMRTRSHRIALKNERSLVARAARMRDGVVVNNVTIAPDFLPNPLLPATRSEMAVPMIVGDTLVGVLDVQSDMVDRFNATDVQVMTTLAGQIAVAVQNGRAFGQIEASRRLLASIINASPDWIFLKDRDYRYVTVNKAFATWYGNRTPEEMIGKNDYDLGTPAFLIDGDPEKGIRGFRADDRDVMETGQVILNGNDVVNFPDGSLHTFDTRKLPMRDSDGKVLGVLGLSRDITDLQKRAAELEIVAKVSAAANTILDVDQLLTTVANLTKTSFNLYHAHIYVLDSTGQYLLLAAGAGETGQIMKSRGHRIALRNERSLVARAARNSEGVVVNDVTAVEDFLPNPLLPETHSEMAVPMVIGDTVLGVLDVQAEDVDRFSPTDVQVMTTLAAQIAVAIQNGRTFAQVESSRRLLDSIINASPDWIFLKDRDYRYVMVNKAFATWYGNRAPEEMVGKNDYDLGTPAFLIEGDPEKGIRGFRADDTEVLETGQMIQNANDVVNYPDGSLHTLDTRKIPLRDNDGKVIGILGLSRDITDQKHAQADLQKRAVELEAVAKVSAAASTILDVDQLLYTVADLTKESFNLYHAHIYTLDPTGQYLVLAAGAGETGRVMKSRGHRIALRNERSLVARAARSREGVVVNDVTAVQDFLPNPLLPDTHAEMAVPIVIGDTLIGVLDVQAEETDRFTPTDVQVMSTLAGQIGVAIQNGRTFGQIESSRRLLDSIINASPDWIFLKDRDYRYVMVNAAFATWYGNRTPEEMIGKNDYDLGTPAFLIEGDPEKGIRGFRADDNDVLETGQMIQNGNDVVNYADGSLHVLDTRKIPLRDNDGKVIGVLGLSRDVTDQRNAQIDLQKRAVELETVAKVSAAASTILDVEKLLTSVSDLTKASFNLYHAHIYLLDEAGENLTLAGGAGETGEAMKSRGHRIAMKNERSLVARAARSREGVVVNDVTAVADFLPNPLLPDTRSEMAVPMVVGKTLVGVMDVQADMPNRFSPTDVQVMTTLTDQVAVAVQNARLYAHQAETAEQLRTVDRLKSEFLANMSHELRTPLNSIIGYAEVLIDGIDGELPEEAVEDVNAIHDSGQHLLSMINDILDLAKIEAGRMELDIEPVMLTDVADEVARITSILLKEKPVELVIDIPESLPQLVGDKVRLRQILNNLVANAAKFTNKGEIRIHAQPHTQPNMVLISVRDTGEGIAPHHLDLVFQQFRQVDSSSTRKAGGTGMGLTITRHLVNMHGGEIWVESELGKGSTFRFTIPTEPKV